MKFEVLLNDGGRTELFVIDQETITEAEDELVDELLNGYIETLRVEGTIKITRTE